MCTVGFDGVTSFGWPGENASPSLQKRSEPSDDRVSLKLERDSYFLNAKLLLSDDFEELEVTSRLSIGVVRIFLTDSNIVIAKFTEECPRKKLLTHLRTHAIEEINIELDPTEDGVMCLTAAAGGLFLYRIRGGCESVASWMNRVFRLRRNTISPSFSHMSTMDDKQLPTLCCDRLQLPHPHNVHVDELTANELEGDDRVSLRKFSPLKRHKAFRNSDLESFRSRTRSSSAPPDDNKPPSKITTTKGGIDIITIKNSASESPTAGTRQSSLRKGKLKMSPRAKRFTRALSARIIHTPVNDSTSEEKTVEVRRAKSLNHTAHSLTLPRSSKRKKNRSRSKQELFGHNTTPPPGTPTKPKSPGSILKIFNRKSGVSSYSLEEYMSSMEEQDLKSVDVHNKPKQLKLYLQPPKQLAEELSLIDAELFCNIQQAELQDGAWTKKNKHSTSPNILKMIDLFNRLSRIVCTEIVHEKTVSGRAKAITSYIQIASKLYKLHNYNSMKAVISGLQSQAVYRLEKSWSQVPSRRRKKFEKHSSFMSQMDSADQFAEFMQYNLTNNIQCIPFLGWLLTYTIHYQTFKKLQVKNESETHLQHHSTSVYCSSPRQSLRESTSNVSLPSSPLHLDSDEESKMHSIVENFSADLLQFSKSLSDTCMEKYARGSSSTVTAHGSSHHDEVDFYFPDTETSNDFLHPLTSNSTCFINPVAFSRLQHDQQSRSSSSSIEESVQTDSAIGLDSSTGQPSPAHRLQNCFVNPLKQRTIQFANSSQTKLQFKSMPSLSDYFDNSDGCLLDIVNKSKDEESDSEGRPDRGFSSSFMGASLSSSQSPVISPSMISISLISEPSTPQKTLRQSELFNTRQCCPCSSSANSLNCLEDSTLSLFSCGVLFTTSTPSINPLYSQGLVSFEDIKRQVQDFLSFTNPRIGSERNNLANLVKFSTPINSVLNIAATSTLPDNQEDTSTTERNETADQDSLSQTSCSKKNESAENCLSPVNDSVLIQHQLNTLNYSCELTSRRHMRYLINTVPCLDENQCYKVSIDVEPSSS